jgi:hypothetical protein
LWVLACHVEEAAGLRIILVRSPFSWSIVSGACYRRCDFLWARFSRRRAK